MSRKNVLLLCDDAARHTGTVDNHIQALKEFSASNVVIMDSRAAGSMDIDLELFDAIVFHEIIHSCGGTELDSEAFENHCYRNCGATAPTSDDFPKFRDDGGRWVNWNGSSGAVTTKDGQALNVNNSGFVDPSPPSGGGGGWI